MVFHDKLCIEMVFNDNLCVEMVFHDKQCVKMSLSKEETDKMFELPKPYVVQTVAQITDCLSPN